MNSKITFFLMTFLMISCGDSFNPGSSFSNASFSNKSVLIKAPHSIIETLRVKDLFFEPQYMKHDTNAVGYFDPAQLQNLSSRDQEKIRYIDEGMWAIGFYDRETLRPKDNGDYPDNIAEGYHNYEALTNELKVITEQYPSFVRMASAGKSVEGREIWYIVVSDKVNENEHEPKFIYHANMHGDEVIPRELMLTLTRYMLENYNKDARIKQIIDNAELFILPSLNPDGFEHRMRSNVNGYDLNRTLPDRFTSPEDTTDGREPEIQAIMNLAKDNHFVYGINWHGGEICFNLPWGNISNENIEDRHGDDDMFNPIGREYTKLNKAMYQNHEDSFDHGLTYGYEWYPVNGGINDWFNYYRRSLHAVIEIAVEKWPSASTLPSFWNENKDGMITYLWRGLRGVHLEIRSVSGELVKNPRIEVNTALRRPLEFDDGYVHRLTSDGKQTVTISVAGYKSKTIEVNSSYFDGLYTKVILEKE